VVDVRDDGDVAQVVAGGQDFLRDRGVMLRSLMWGGLMWGGHA
jgi:hypothetical protein